MVQHRRSRALRRRRPVYRRPYQGTDHPLRLQRLSGRGRSGAERASGSRSVGVIGRAAIDNEEVVAFVQLLPGSTVKPADLMAHAARQLAPYKRPCEIIVLDALPAGSTGKILKHRLAETARDRTIAPT